MKTSKIFLSLGLITGLSWSASKAERKQELENLKREVEVLELMKKKKLDSLEAVEAKRWNLRFAQREELRLLEENGRQLETNYSRQANEMSRRQEDLIAMRNFTEEAEEKLETNQRKLEGLRLQVKQSIEKAAESVGSDFPYQVTERTAQLSKAQSMIEDAGQDLAQALEPLYSERVQRARMTSEQELVTKSSLFQKGGERTVWSLRLGSVFLTDVDKNNSDFQSLFRTGALQGKLFTWKSSFNSDYSSEVTSLVQNSQKSGEFKVPIDVLQNGKLGQSVVVEEEASFLQKAKSWFATGGLVMYPLMGCALLALILAIERGVLFRRRMKKLKTTRDELMPLIRQGKFEEAGDYCDRLGTTTAAAIHEIVDNRDGTREGTERAVRKVLLSEVPALEKRLGLISALGASAPLMGLLGTVSGMITLFKVITDVGTNDARILAGGISEALVTTQTGLIVAIPILLIHGYLAENLDNLIAKLNETVMEALNLVWPDSKGEEK